MDTIFAPATARGRAGISIVRISGPDAHTSVAALCGSLPPMQRASMRKLVWDGVQIDECLVILFQMGNSFTGEPIAELHLHGSIAVVAAALSALSQQPNLRPAQPGEFTRRALDNGRLDLTQVEGLAALIDAETEAQRKQALRILSGAIGRRAEEWRRNVIRAAALLEATIDFADEDVPLDVRPEVLDLIGNLILSLQDQVSGAAIAERIRDGFEVAIVGAPNAGKSTLLNALAGRDVAMTSEIAGTTRDVIEVRMDLGGIPVTMLDTAGLRNSSDILENIGMDRAVARAELADVRIFLLMDEDAPIGIVPRADDLFVRGKADISKSATDGLSVSGVSGKGIPELLEAVGTILQARVAGATLLTHARQRKGATDAIFALEAAQAEVELGLHRTELAAENLRLAIRALDALVGRVDVENLLDEIFSSFCIGK